MDFTIVRWFPVGPLRRIVGNERRIIAAIRIEVYKMTTKMIKAVAATSMALSLGFIAAPVASAATTPAPPPAEPVVTIAVCVPFGSVIFCI